MLRAICLLSVWLLLASQSARADEDAARQHFDAGVVASEANRWEDAAEQFESSLAQSDRPATRFNLILAYQHLQRPLDVVRQALHFLSDASGAGREEARARAATLLAEAKQKLAVLNVAALPVGTQLEVDGQAPELVYQGIVYVLPGVHHLQLQLGQKIHETIEITLSAGQELPWPRLGRSALEVPAPAEPRAEGPTAPSQRIPINKSIYDMPLTIVRTRAAWALGTVGAALAVAAGTCWLVADRRSDRLRKGGIARAQEPGYFDALDRYGTSVDAIMPLAFSGGALMASAILVGERITHRGSLAWSVASIATGALLLGFGTYWLAREPYHVIPKTGIERPSRQWGSLLFSTGLPLITYGAAFPIVRKRGGQLSAGLSTVRFAW